MRVLKKLVVLVGFVLLVASGCGSEKTMTCTRTMDQNGMKADLRYEVNYKGSTVSKVKSTEKITIEGDDVTDTLETYKTTVENTYAPYKDVEHYNYNVSVDGNTLTSTVDIDYSKIDTKKMIEIDSANGQLIKDGKINIDDLKSAYSAAGITCEK